MNTLIYVADYAKVGKTMSPQRRHRTDCPHFGPEPPWNTPMRRATPREMRAVTPCEDCLKKEAKQ